MLSLTSEVTHPHFHRILSITKSTLIQQRGDWLCKGMNTMRSSPLRANAGYHRWPLGTLQMLGFYDWWEFRTIFNNTEIHAFSWKETKCYRCTKLSMVVLLISRTCEYVTLHEKSDFEIRIQLKTLRWGNYFGLSRLAQDRGKCDYKERIWETAVWGLSPHHADFEDGGRDQKILVISRSWKRQANRFSPHAFQKEPSLDFSSVRLMLGFWPAEL